MYIDKVISLWDSVLPKKISEQRNQLEVATKGPTMNLARSLATIALAASALSIATATAQTYYDMHPGEQAMYSFHFDGATTLSNRTPNILALFPGGGLGYHDCDPCRCLYDGNNLLGA